jgi:hypothetical protein
MAYPRALVVRPRRPPRSLAAYPRPAGLGDLPAPVQWIKDKLGEFFALPARIAAARAKSQQLEAIATSKGATDAVQVLRDARANLDKASADQSGLQDRVRWIMEQLGKIGIHLGQVVSITIVVVAGAVAVAMAALFSNVKKQESIINAVRDKILTPAEAADFAAKSKSPLVNLDLGKLLLPAALIGGAVLFGPQVVRALKRATR